MTARKDTTHVLIERELLLAQRPRSSVWQCRYCIDGMWQHVTTGERDLKLAKKRAHEILVEAKLRKKMQVAPITRRFRDVAKHTLKRMAKEIASGNGKASYRDYTLAINNYLIPILGSYHVDNIDYQALQKLDEERKRRMGKEPTRSTLLTHNAALNLVFDEAIYRGYMVESSRPKLQIKGKKSERRIEFNVDEVRAIRANFDAWIERARADAKPVRQLLKDYVEVLLDTGARPGKELLELRWVQVEIKMYPTIKKTGVITKGNEYDSEDEEEVVINSNKTAILKIQNGKTGARTAIGRLPTVKALNRIAERNYAKTAMELIDKGSNDLIFRFKEWLSKEEIAAKKKVKLITPTSFVKLFATYLREHNLLTDPVTNKQRQFYSLRHTYATMALTNDKVPIHTLAKQMGTSVGMIEKHYSHLEPVKAVHQLRGEETRLLIDAIDEVDDKYAFDETKAKSSRKSKKSTK
jgi:integrase